ncbi:hypothetical protein D3C85_1215340 [compost metagenome]
MKQDGRGDVVGQIAHHAQLLRLQLLRHSGEIDLEHIGFDDIELLVQTQAKRQVAVQLDHRDAAQALDQGLRQSHQAGTDFHHGIAGFGVDRVDNCIDDAAIGQKVLTEAFTGNVFQTKPYCGGSRYSTYARPRTSCTQVL